MCVAVCMCVECVSVGAVALPLYSVLGYSLQSANKTVCLWQQENFHPKMLQHFFSNSTKLQASVW